MAYSRTQKKQMKKYLIIAGVVALAYYVVFVTVAGKAFVNGIALKMGVGTAAVPLIK